MRKAYRRATGCDREGKEMIVYRNGFDLSESFRMAEHAALAYDEAEHRARAADMGFGFNWIERGAAQCAVLSSRKEILVVFPGTADPGDWVDDVRSICRVRWNDTLPGTVGRGFRRQAEAIWPEVETVVRRCAEHNTSAQVVLVGHSLGAAIATLTRVYLERRAGVAVEALYSFGSPRVGDLEFFEWYRRALNGQHWSIRNTRDDRADLVTRVPKRSWGFRHVGTPVILIENGLSFSPERWHEIRSRDPVGSWRCVRIIRQAAWDIRAHSMRETVDSLGRICRRLRNPADPAKAAGNTNGETR